MNQVLVGIMWRDIHHPWKEQRVQLLNYYDGIFQLMQLVPADASPITIETDASLQNILLHPDQSEWLMRFQARRVHALFNSFHHVRFSPLHPHTVRFSKLISRLSGPPMLNVDNIDILYSSIIERFR
eukprot:TRINITY_DN17339_c0_g1_i2.p1 TRINITY_DN17339_c0_g1~~TRINITY_DN17339_c0_g1_i2.p1  ORF type:complete len:140 (+),score=17.89 TRINITY_DN17339_c0_g1_i2:40-420(+)